MADLGYTQAQWDRFNQELSAFVRVGRWIEKIRRRVAKQRTQVLNIGDLNENVAALSLTGVKYGVNCEQNGVFYLRTTANGPNWDFQLYKAVGAGGGDEVAQALNVAADATLAWTAVNSSGIGGSITAGSSPAAVAVDTHKIKALLDWKLEAEDVFPADGAATETTDDDLASRAAWGRMLSSLASTAEGMLATWEAALTEWALGAGDNPIGRGIAHLKSQDGSLYAEGANDDGEGTITQLRTGFLQTLFAAWRDESSGAIELKERGMSATAGTAASTNDGQGTIASHSPGDHFPAGEVTLRCVGGIGTSEGGSERFALTFRPDEDADPLAFNAQLTVGKSYRGVRGFGPITLARSLTKTGDAGNTDFGAASTFDVTGENEQNTDEGVLHLKITSNATTPANWDVAFHSSASFSAGTLVAKVENVATSATDVVATSRNVSGLQVTFDIGSGPADTNTATLDLNFFHVQNSNDVPDEFKITVTEDADPGIGAKIIAVLLDAPVNSDTAGGETLTDADFVEAGHVPLANEDF